MVISDSVRRAQPWLGTFVEIAASGACNLHGAIGAAFEAVAQVHRLMSFHDAQSDVSRINREAFAGAVAVHPLTYRVIETALELHRRSAGRFDIMVAPLLQRHGLLPGDAGTCGAATESTRVTEAIELLGDGRLRTHSPSVKIDLGGIAKGFAVDCAIAVLRRQGAAHGVVNAGGDLAVFGPEPEKVHIRNPKTAGELLCTVEIAETALASSGRIFDSHRSAHIGETAVFDPDLRAPVRAIAGATVCAPSCMIADALTKVVMIAAEEAVPLLHNYRARALLMLESGDVRITQDWQSAVRLAA
jgi:FAD:protein FMN transferase